MIAASKELFPGVLSVVTVALAAKFLSEHYGAPVMLMALLIGMAFAFLAEAGSITEPGIEFASKKLLRFGVALLGLGITFQQIAALGVGVFVLTISAVILTLLFGLFLSQAYGRGIQFGLLIGGAVAICGASAALAISSVLHRSERLERDTVFTVIAVTLLSTVAMVLYPVIAGWLQLSDIDTGVFFGATIHDVAQVVGAGYTVSDEAGETATFVKLFRVALLVPVVLLFSVIFSDQKESSKRLPVPLFVLGFAALVVAGSFSLVPEIVKQTLLDLSRWCLIVAIAALGMKTSLGKLGEVGGSAVALVCILTVLLAVFVLVSIKFVLI